MSTAEILIVFSALMVLIALVTIGIDWIGKPLKHRRFIPRMYRFDDEKLPVDEYGNTNFEALDSADYEHAPSAGPAPYPPPGLHHPGLHQPGQIQVPGFLAPVPDAHGEERVNPTVVVPVQSPPRQVAQLDPELAASSTANRSAFSDSLSSDEIEPAGSTSTEGRNDLFDSSAIADHDLFTRSAIAGTGQAQTPAQTPATHSDSAWSPAKPLDTTVNDQKPSLATKAERFWKATAEANTDSHFDDDDLARMGQGKAPRRDNPRTGKTEAMQLTGLRQASDRIDVRMQWPDDAVDPWNGS